MLEALASGVPTITTNTSSVPEVAGDAAMLVNPRDPNALAEAMSAILSSPELEQKLRREGPVQASKFTWEQTAAATAEVYRKLG